MHDCILTRQQWTEYLVPLPGRVCFNRLQSVSLLLCLWHCSWFTVYHQLCSASFLISEHLSHLHCLPDFCKYLSCQPCSLALRVSGGRDGFTHNFKLIVGMGLRWGSSERKYRVRIQWKEERESISLALRCLVIKIFHTVLYILWWTFPQSVNIGNTINITTDIIKTLTCLEPFMNV